MPRQITPRTTLDNLKLEAKRWLRAIRANVAEARDRLLRVQPRAPESPNLRDVQHALALEYGLPGWTALKQRLAADSPMRRYEQVAAALVIAYRTSEGSAMEIVYDYFEHRRRWDAMRRYVRLDLGRTEEPASGETDDISLADAQRLVARRQGLASWEALERYAATLPIGKTNIAEKPVLLYAAGNDASNDPIAAVRDWDDVLAAIREQLLGGLDAQGQMTDALLEQISRLEHITVLDLGGSKALTDEGLRHLSRLPRLRRVNLSGCSGITDRGFEVVKHLPDLQWVSVEWTYLTDAGAASLASCPKLTTVMLSGTQSGDGAIAALGGHPRLAHFRSGEHVTDAGLARLHDLPAFKTWQGGESAMSLTGFDAGPTFLMMRGPFTNAGLAQLVGLDGLAALNIDSSRLAVTGAGLAPLVDLPHFNWLAFDAKDDSMPNIAALPHLRFLMCQDTSAGDDGFVALSRSRSLEYIWGRRCYNLQRRGFMALAGMPALRALSVSCKYVDDVGLSALPRFPALEELMPMDVPDAGYRHIGKCARLESLVLMYCRDTGDGATEYLPSLTRLKKYFASYNRITDHTPEILSRVPSLEEVTFDTCVGLTNEGVASLARLPRLRRVRVSGMPGVTGEIVARFPTSVEVSHSV
jgi:Leucine Rich repeat